MKFTDPRNKISFFFFVPGLLILSIAILFEAFGAGFLNKISYQHARDHIQNDVIEKQEKIHSLFSLLSGKEIGQLTTNFDQYINYSRENNLLLYVYQRGNLILWSDNRVLPNKVNVELDLWVTILKNGVFLQSAKHQDDLLFIVLSPVQNRYALENNYLVNELFPGRNIIDGISLSLNPSDGKNIYSSDENFLFSLKFRKQPFPGWVKWLYVAGLVILSLGFYLFLLVKSRKTAILIFTVYALVITLFWKILRLPSVLFEHEVFKPYYYASSEFLSSLGDLLIFVILITLFISLLTAKFRDLIIRGSKPAMIAAVVFLFITLQLTNLINFTLRGLVINSNIPLDFQNFFELNYLSIIGFLIIFLLFFNFIRLSFWFFNICQEGLKSQKSFITAAAIILFIFILQRFFLIEDSWLTWLFTFLTWFVFLYWKKNPFKVYQLILYLVFLTSFYASFNLIKHNEDKERQARKLLATKLASKRDMFTEYLFKDISREIRDDKYIKSFFINPFLSKSFIEKRIQKLYFSGYLGKYDLEVNTFGSGGLPLRTDFSSSLQDINNLLAKFGKPTGNAHLFFLDAPGENPVYLAIYNFQSIGNSTGSLVIKLKNKAVYEESIYPSLLISEDYATPERDKEYSYAVYYNNRLISQKGDYPYPVSSPISNVDRPFFFFTRENYSHLFHHVNTQSFVVISLKKQPILQTLSTFSSLFIIFFILSFLLYLFQKPLLFKPHTWWKQNLLFESKIRLVILFSVFLALGIVGFSTISYLKAKYNAQQKDDLREKINLVLDNFEEQLFKSRPLPFQTGDGQELFSIVKELSDLHRLDINIYNLNGQLITSSQPQIFERNIVERLMDGEAYYAMRVVQKSQHLQSEKIGNLEFISVYSPIRDENNRITGFLHLPYFARETELKEEISSLIITLANLYVFIFLMVILISIVIANALTKPLSLIREKISKTQVGHHNEPINYQSNDELGQLVQSYNRMLVELERSAKKLAESEREGAWREMARQVAHEIKNPLTPMKLNIQRLQQALKNDDPNLPELILKVTRIMITQIEQLTQIATEFSSFARMPAGKPEPVVVEDEIENILELYKAEEGLIFYPEINTSGSIVLMDKGYLSRIFNNLVKNAIQAMEEKDTKEIRLKTWYENNLVFISIADTGTGIPENMKEKIFRPNFSTKTSGMGLGLAIVKRMVENAGGTINFTSEINKGTTFFLSFPLHEKL